MLVLGGLQGDAVHRAGHGAEVAGHAALSARGIASEDDAPPVARWKVRPFFGEEHGVPAPEEMREDGPYGFEDAQHGKPPPPVSRPASAAGVMSP